MMVNLARLLVPLAALAFCIGGFSASHSYNLPPRESRPADAPPEATHLQLGESRTYYFRCGDKVAIFTFCEPITLNIGPYALPDSETPARSPSEAREEVKANIERRQAEPAIAPTRDHQEASSASP
jgi:hypothetical protein